MPDDLFRKPAPAGAFNGLTRHHYGVIYADPPWHFENWSEKGEDRNPNQHYRVMSIEDLAAMPVADLAAADCALFLWVIDPMLPQGLELMRAWGFDYSTVAFTWVKTRKSGAWHMGMGYWTRSNPEMCLLGTRGSPKRLGRGVRQVVAADIADVDECQPLRPCVDCETRQLCTAQLTEHSRKPNDIRKRIVELVPGPYAELFARERAPGWDGWGNEYGKNGTLLS